MLPNFILFLSFKRFLNLVLGRFELVALVFSSVVFKLILKVIVHFVPVAIKVPIQ